MKEGRKEGKKEGLKEAAKNFRGILPDEEIAKRTGLDLKTVNQL